MDNTIDVLYALLEGTWHSREDVEEFVNQLKAEIKQEVMNEIQENEPKISITIGQALHSGYFDEICEESGLNPWCLNEGLATDDDTVSISIGLASRAGLL